MVRYFGNKSGLLEAVYSEGWTRLIRRIACLVTPAPTARDAVITILATMIGAFERNPSLAKRFYFEEHRLRSD